MVVGGGGWWWMGSQNSPPGETFWCVMHIQFGVLSTFSLVCCAHSVWCAVHIQFRVLCTFERVSSSLFRAYPFGGSSYFYSKKREAFRISVHCF